MRWSLLLLLVAIPALAFAEPKVAVAPLDGDNGDVADVVAEVASDRAKVLKPGRVEGAMRSMGVSVLSAKSLKKLRAKLDVDVVIYGELDKEGNVKRLSLQLSGSGKSKLKISFASLKGLRKELAAKLPKRIDDALEGEGGDDDEDEERAKREEEARARREAEERKKREEEEERKREEERRAEERRKKEKEEEDRRKREKEDQERRAERKKKRDKDDEDEEEDDRRASRKKRKGDDDDRRKKRVADREDDEDSEDSEDEAEDEDEERPRRKRKRRGDEKRHDLTQAALWLDAGAAVARRTFTYDATGMMRPPPVGTAAPAGRIEGEVYPAAFSSLRGPAAGIGVFGAYSRTFALGIAVPGTQITVPIQNGQYSIGGQYRLAFGEHSVAFRLAYWRSYFMADRTKLMDPGQLDMPDVDYSAIAPGIAARIAATPKIAAFATLDVPLMLYSGPIQDPASYGSSKILAFDIRAGAQITLASHVAVQLGLDFEQIGLSFTGQAGSMAETRMVTKATDRSIGIGATVGVFY